MMTFILISFNKMSYTNSDAFERHITQQEKYVNDNFRTVKNQLKNFDCSDLQIRNKLRQQYNNSGNSGNKNDYILDSIWKNIKL